MILNDKEEKYINDLMLNKEQELYDTKKIIDKLNGRIIILENDLKQLKGLKEESVYDNYYSTFENDD